MDLEELRAFLAVADTGSYLAAASSLSVSRTTLRRRVEALEGRAGVPLLKSTRTGVVLTDAGKVLAGRGQAVMQEASVLLASIRDVGHKPAGVLRAIVPVGMPPHLLTPLFASLREAYPQLHVHCRFSQDPLGELLVDTDLAVHFGQDGPRGPWLSYEILQVREWLVASGEYLARRGTPGSIEELARHELLSWQAPGEDACHWPTLEGTTFPVKPALVATDINFVRRCCMAGLGIGLVPDAGLPDPELPESPLVPVLPDLVGRERTLSVTLPAALAEVPKIRMVLEHVRSFLERS